MDATGRNSVARRAARALFDVARAESANLDQIEQELMAFENLLQAHPDVRRVLNSPAVPGSRKAAVVGELSTRLGTSAVVSKLLALLASRHAFALLPELVAEFGRRVLEHRGVVDALVTTAIPLDESRIRVVADRLGQAVGRTLRIRHVVDPSIIGGIIAKVGNTVYDGSLAGQLQRLKRHLVTAPLLESTPIPAHV